MGSGPFHRVFVYGTLRRGGCNHSLLADATWLGTAYTKPAYELVDLGDFPAVVEGGNAAIYGELYVVDEPTLVALDELEEVPEYYRRVETWIAGVPTQLYVLPREEAHGFPRIPEGYWPPNRFGGP